MTSQPVKYTFEDADSDRLLIRSSGRVTRAFLHTSNIDGFYVAPADAADVALALLECAGLSVPSRVLRDLEALGRDERQKVEDAKRAEEEAAKAKAEEEAKAKAADEALDALALRLLNAHREAAGFPRLSSLAGRTMIDRDAWRAVARATQAAPEPPRFSLVAAEADGWSTREAHVWGIHDAETGYVAPFGPRRDFADDGLQALTEGLVPVDAYGWIREPTPEYKPAA